MRRGGRMVTAGFLLIGAVAVVAGGEIFMRLRDARRGGTGGAAPLLYYRHRRLQRAFVRGASEGDRVHISRQGFRGVDVAEHKTAGTTRVIAVGASATFDVCARTDSAAWPARLQYWLGALHPGRRFEVINAGVPGYLMLDNIIRLQQELYRYEPDVIVLYAGHGTVDMAPAPADDEGARATPDALPAIAPWEEWLGRHSHLYAAITRRLRARPVGAVPQRTRAQVDSTLDRAAADFRRDLVSFVLIGQGLGADVVLVELAHLGGSTAAESLPPRVAAVWRAAFGVDPAITLEGLRRYRDVQRAVADSLRARLVLVDGFGIADPGQYCPGDPLHLNETGADRLARGLAQALVARRRPSSSGTPLVAH